MAFPTFVAAGAPANGTGSVSPGLPSGWAAGDKHVLLVNCKRLESLSTPSGWTLVDTSVPTGDNKLTIFERDAQSGDAAPTVADPGDHLYAVILGFRGTAMEITGSIAAQINTDSTAAVWPSLTTTDADQLILLAMAHGLDSTGAKASGYANANLTSLTERFDNSITSNDGGGLVAVTGLKATAGATGTTTATMSTATIMSLITLSLGSAGPTGATGSMDAEESGADVFAGDGEVAVTGDLAGIETGADSFVGAGAVALAGEMAAVETGADTLAGTGAVVVTGTMAVDETGADAFSGSGSIADPGILGVMDAVEIGSDTLAAAGTVAVSGILDATETGTDSFAGEGSVSDGITGQMEAYETGPDTFAGTGTAEGGKRPGGGWGPSPRRPRVYIYHEPEPEEEEPKPKAKRVKRKVTKAIVREAMSEMPWLPDWALTEAVAHVPTHFVVPDHGSAELRALMIAITKRLLADAAEDEEEIELLLLAA